jgi:hypothetical protein
MSEISPNWRDTEIETLIREHQLSVMMSPGGWWFESRLTHKHKCISEQASDEEILERLKEWLET